MIIKTIKGNTVQISGWLVALGLLTVESIVVNGYRVIVNVNGSK